jgi:ferritin-like protein
MASEGFHEPIEWLNDAVINRHRAITSLMEELEAVDWYDQRVAATNDDALRAVLAHNRDEEKEHAAMTLEWLRRHDEKWNDVLRTYLFTDEPITEVEREAEAEDVADAGRGLRLGDLRKEPPR